MTKTAFGRVRLVHTPEKLFAERKVAALVRDALAEHAEAEVNCVSVSELADGRFAELIGGSLFSSFSVLAILDAAALPNDLIEQVLEVAESTPETLSLILVHDDGAKGKSLLEKLKKLDVEVFELPAVKSWNLPKFLVDEARSLQVSLDLAAAQALIDAVGIDLTALAAAVHQLSSDCDESIITDVIVARYFAGRADVTSFAVADAVMLGRSDIALEKLRWALDTGVSPSFITSAVASALRALGKYLEASKSPLSQPDLARRVGVPPWKLKNLKAQAYGWSPRGVARAIKAVALADGQVKGFASDPAFALEHMVLTVLTARSTR